MTSRDRSETNRVACIVLPELPLQLLVRNRPRLRGFPLACVDEDDPNALLTYVDAKARRLRIVPGMRQSVARQLVPDLHVGVIDAYDLRAFTEEMTHALQTFSPRVEPAENVAGVYYLDPRGLSPIYGGLRSWAETVRGYVRGRSLLASIVVGFTRSRAQAIARTRNGVLVLRSTAHEQSLASEVPLSALIHTPELRDALGMLEIHTLGDFLALPAAAVRSRFGDEAGALHALYVEGAQLPIKPDPLSEPVKVELEIEPPDDDHARLLFATKGALHPLLQIVTRRSEAVVALRITLACIGGSKHEERIEPATATRDAMLLLELVRLRLADKKLDGLVEGIVLEAECIRTHGEQLTLPSTRASRDLDAGARALARVKAAYGPRSATRAVLKDAHLPEAKFTYEPVSELALPRSEPKTGDASFVRRVLKRPKRLASRIASAKPPATSNRQLVEKAPNTEPLLDHGSTIAHMYGPYRISGGWWVREVERDYYYAQTEQGELLWIYYDRPRKSWYLHGVID